MVDDVIARTSPVSAKTFHGVIVESDKEVITSDGNIYVQIVYKVQNTKFAPNIRAAANHWNQLFGRTIFIEASTSTKVEDINLIFNNVSSGSFLARVFSMGRIELNTYYLGKHTLE
ncbi:hypothetical protein RyT2_02340 [Pseudolactococcus yaeyamensis]